MAEPERSPSITAQPESPANLPPSSASASVSAAGTQPTFTATRLTPAHWKAIVLATLGAAFGSMIGSSIFGELFPAQNEKDKQSLGQFLIVAIIIGAAAYWFFDPLMELVQGWMGIPPREIPKERRIVTSIAVVAATLMISILHHSLATSLEHLGLVGFIIFILFFACTAGVTTWYWLRGIRRQPPRPASYGAKSGTVAGAVAGFIIVLMVLARKNAASSHWITASDAQFVFSRTGLWTILTLIPGLLGGLAIEQSWDRKSPTRGILIAMAAFSGVALMGALIVGQMLPQYNQWAWFIGLQSVTLSLGWALGPFLQRESCDRVFDVSGAPAPEAAAMLPPEFRKAGTVVVPIDSHRPAATPETPSSATTANQPVSPTILLLQPKGSRAWSLAILVAALAIGGWAYATGAIRTDSEIVSEIVGKFAHDSGLNGKFLTAQSAQHVVTVSGMVDNGLEHTAAVEHASSVRGVKQVIDQIQLVAPAAPKPKAAVVAEQPAQGPTFNANISIGKSGGAANQVNGNQRTVAQRPATAQPKQQQQQKRGLFHWFKKKKNSNQN